MNALQQLWLRGGFPLSLLAADVIEQGSRRLGLEIKFSAAPQVGKGFWPALADLQPERTAFVAPVARRYPVKAGVDVLPVRDIIGWLAES